MAKKYLDSNGLSHFWTKIKAYITSVLPVASSTTPKMDGTATTGSETAFAKGDHIHPTDTSRAPTSHASSGTTYGKGTNGNYGHVKLSDATAGTEAAASGGTAATPKAVKDALDAAKSYADGLDTGVSDVKVDGTSVVTGGVAAVDLSGKVDKVTGKGLSTNDYTTAEKTKLSGIASGAEVNVQADWNATDSASDAYIKNKPTFTEDDHKWNDVELAHADFATDIGTESDYRGYVPVIGGVVGNTNPSLNATTSKMLKISTIAADVNTMVARDKNGYIWVKTPTNGDSTGRAATTAFVSSAVSGKVDSSSVGSANGVAPLDASGKIASTYLPSYVDDVIEAYPRSGATELSSSWLSTSSGGSALTPETGKIYVLMADSTSYATNTQFRWSGTTYVKLSDGGVSEITTAEIDTIVAS